MERKIYSKAVIYASFNDFIDLCCVLGGDVKVPTKVLLNAYRIFNRNSTHGKLKLYKFLQQNKGVIKTEKWLYGITLKSHMYDSNSIPQKMLNRVKKDDQLVQPTTNRILMVDRLYDMADQEKVKPVEDITECLLFDYDTNTHIFDIMDICPSFGYTFSEPLDYDYTSIFDDIEL